MDSLWFYQIPLLGRCGIEGDDTHITRLLLGSEAVGERRGDETSLMAEAARQLTEYAEGKRQQFTVPVRPEGTPFQRRVWEYLCQIPFGEHRAYGEIAAAFGMSGGARAVGNAVGANPIPVLIPCHRVLAAGGRLGGFRLGADLKVKLLELEHIAHHDRKIEKF